MIIDNTHNSKANTITMMCFGLVFTFMSLLTVGGKTKAANEPDELATTLNSAMIEDEADTNGVVEDY
jgi:hypothetical protein